MLAVQMIQITWTKEHRNPEASVQRRQFLRPHPLSEQADLHGSGIFLNRLDYLQSQGEILTSAAYKRKFTRYSDENAQHRYLLNISKAEQAHSGMWFARPEELQLPCVNIRQEGSAFRIFWHQDTTYSGKRPIRTGHNEEFYDSHSPFCGKNLCNETAFILQNGESGRMQYNYRVTTYEGQYYEQYCIYFVHTDIMTPDLFTSADYTHEYNQLAHLF